MRKFPDADHVYIMCDGDVAPFKAKASYRSTDDSIFRDIAHPQYCSDEAKKDQVEWKVTSCKCIYHCHIDRPLFAGLLAEAQF